MTASREQLLEVARRAALAAGEAILKVYATAFDVQQKTDNTPVTEADLASERIIVATLTEAFPEIPIASEELVEAEGLPPWAARFWAVDPLDGTKEFIARNGGAPEPIQARTPPADGLVVIHSRSHENSRRLAEFLQSYPVRERKKCGSALKFGVIAAGEADLYPRFGTTMEWDTAAGQAILEAAGGYVETADGRPLGYGKLGLKNDGFLAWGRRSAD